MTESESTEKPVASESGDSPIRKVLQRVRIGFYDPDAHREYRENYKDFLLQDIKVRSQRKQIPVDPRLKQLEVVTLETIRLDLLQDDELDAQTAFVSERYRVIADSPPIEPPSQDSPAAQKRAWNAQVLWEGHRLHLSNQTKAKNLGNHIRQFSLYVLVQVLTAFAVFLFMDKSDTTYLIPPYILAMIAGSLGGAVNHLRRLTSAKLPKGPEVLSYELDTIRRSSLSTLVAGALYGLVIFFIAASGLGKLLGGEGTVGSLFPQIDLVQVGFDTKAPAKEVSGLHGLLGLTMGLPPTVEYAKLLVWCFASGFIPTLVPDFVSSLQKRKPE